MAAPASPVWWFRCQRCDHLYTTRVINRLCPPCVHSGAVDSGEAGAC